MNAAFIALSAAVSLFLIFWGLTRSAIVSLSRSLELPEDEDWAPGADAPFIFRFFGQAAKRVNRDVGMGSLLDRVPGERMALIERVIVQAGSPWGINARGLVATQVMAGVIGTVAGVYLMLILEMNWMWGLLMGVALTLAPRSIINGKARKRTSEIRRALPSMLDLLVVNAESGRSLRAGFETVSQKMEGPLAEEMEFCTRMLQVGTNEEQVFDLLAERTMLPEVEELASSLTTSVKYGGIDIRAALRLLAKQTRERWRQEIEGKINKLTVKLVFPIFAFLFPSFLLLVLGPALLTFGDRL